MRKPIAIIAAVFSAFFLANCERGVRNNPFENPNGSDTTVLEGFAALHSYILEPKCANPGCHDGSFEPDFRTVEGSYATMVYHPVIKNDADGSYTYRVVPGDPDASWLMSRITTTNDTLGRMPLYMEPLSREEIELFEQWILDGAPNSLGELPVAPNEMPRMNWYAALNGALNWADLSNRIDNNRDEYQHPFKAFATDTLLLLFNFSDDQTAPEDFTDMELRLGKGPAMANATLHVPVHLEGPVYQLMFPPNTFNIGDTMYFQLSFSDGANFVQTPNTESPWWFVDNMSFYVD